MEASSSDQIILYPYVSEIKPILNRVLPELPSNSYLVDSMKNLDSRLPMKTIKKSVGEQNNEKGSSNLILIPHRHQNMQGDGSTISLYSIDYNPVLSKSKVQKEIQDMLDENIDVQKAVNYIADWSNQAG